MGMMTLEMIDAYVDKNSDLTSYIVEGKFTAMQVIATIEAFHRAIPTKHVLLDFSATHVNHLQNFEIERIANVVNKNAYTGKFVKTALVFSSDADFGLGRMFEALSQNGGVPQKIMSFHTVEEARKWLDADY